MSRYNRYGFGLITDTDVILLKFSLDVAARSFGDAPLRIVEIGIFDGETSRGIQRYLKGKIVKFEYWAVDSGKECKRKPFDECTMIWGESTEVHMKVPPQLHLLLIDGCHCINHTMLDFLHYGDRVVSGGFVLFHDTSPMAQNKKDYQGHGPRDSSDFGTATREAIRKLGLSGELETWKLIEDKWDGKNDFGGMCLFQKVALE